LFKLLCNKTFINAAKKLCQESLHSFRVDKSLSWPFNKIGDNWIGIIGEEKNRREERIREWEEGVKYWQSSSSLYTASQLRPFPVSTEARNKKKKEQIKVIKKGEDGEKREPRNRKKCIKS
jgi:hypothetical protein